MKKILSILSLFISVVAISQPSNYLNIRSRYNLIAIKSDSGFHVPGYSTIPAIRGGVWNGAGNIGIDTVNNKFYFYSGGAWREAGSTNYADSLRRVGLAVQMRKNGSWTTQYIDSVNAPDSFSNGLTKIGGVVKLGGTLSEHTTVNGNNNGFNIDSFSTLGIFGKWNNPDDVISRKNIYTVNSDDSGYDGLFLESISNLSDASFSKVRLVGGDLNLMSSNVVSISSDNSIILNSEKIYLDSISTVSSTTGRKVLVHDTATGKVERVDPASLSTNIYNTDGTLTGSRTVQLDGNTLDFQGSGAEDFSIQNVGAYSLNNVSGSIVLQNTNDSIKLQPFNGNLVIGTLKTTTSTTGHKVLVHDTATGRVERVDPSAFGGWGTADTSYTAIATFTAGGGFASDTTMCTDSTLFGSFYTGQFDYTIASIRAVIKGNAGDSIVLKLVYNDTFNVDGTKVNGAGLSVNNRYTGNTFTISTNRTVPANSWLWLKPEAVITGKKPKYISVTLVGYKTYVAP